MWSPIRVYRHGRSILIRQDGPFPVSSSPVIIVKHWINSSCLTNLLTLTWGGGETVLLLFFCWPPCINSLKRFSSIWIVFCCFSIFFSLLSRSDEASWGTDNSWNKSPKKLDAFLWSYRCTCINVYVVSAYVGIPIHVYWTTTLWTF